MKVPIFSKISIAVALIGIITASTTARAGDCLEGSGNIIGENHSIASFHKIIVETDATVILSQDNTQNLHIQADDNLQNIIKTTIENGTLKISVPKCVSPTKAINIFVSTKNIDELTLSGNGKILAPSTITADAIKFFVKGNGEIKIDELHAEYIYTQIDGNGTITLAGDAISHTIESIGSGEVHAYKLKAINTKLTVTGTGNCEVNTENQLDVRISGNGNVSYKGKPEMVSKDISANGKLTNKN
jgi:hypothetical protein